MDANVTYGSLPFDEAISYFRKKLNVPTERWNDLWQDEHARAFSVAGATKAELLADLRTAIDKAIAEGTTLETFRKDFDGIVAKHGWSYNGERNWRTDTMLNTNIRTAYNAGRYKQMTDPDVLRDRPFWIYRHGHSVHPRPWHLAWDGTVLPADSFWWHTHYTPNGWGCNCTVRSLSHDDLADLGKDGPDETPDDGTYAWTDKSTGQVHKIPNGIDPGWAYNPGEAAWGRPLAKEAMEDAKALGPGAWESLTPGDWSSANRAEHLPSPKATQALEPAPKSMAELRQELGKLLGEENEQVFEAGPGGWRFPVVVDSDALAAVVPLGDAPTLALLPEVFARPDEVWFSFEKLRATGRVAVKARVLKAIKADGRHLVLIASVNERGMLEAWNTLPAGETEAVNRFRRGKLVSGR
jgi:hypothetical protein